MIKEQQELPDGWKYATIDKVATISTGKRDANHAVESGQYKFFTCALEPLAANTYAFDDKAILLPGNGHNVGESFFYTGKFEAYQRTYVLHNIKIEPKYLFYHLQLGWRKATSEKQYGSATNYIRIGNFTDYQLPVAPTDQQKQIVAKIEELFSHIDAGIVSLKTAKQKLKQYRQSVLKAAVTGELTKDWREQNANAKQGCSNVAGGTTPGVTESANQLLKRIQTERRQRWEQQKLSEFQAKGKPPKNDKWKEKYKAPEILQIENLPGLPNDWLWVNMGVLCEKVTDGTHHSPINDENGEFKYITAKNIKPWRIDLKNITYVTKDVHEEIYSRCDVKKGDVLYIKDGATTGVAALNNLDEEFSLLSSVGVLRFPTCCLGEYFVSALNSNLIKDMLLANVAGVAITRLTLTKLKAGMVSLPPIEEQKEIVRIVEEKLSSADRLMTELDTKLTQAQKQKQTILASGFKGELI